ncbi:hypothetical protein L1987_66169 [Smallanthus sonchifolius]|uniref:Uncharacterized protein n=1 Tax=Smallanthus sonchifolius TaxID=185202 RepID=A0ACB9BWN6_9ASTR|nr:hypothetical protein L1987_66169 [Smallanthus sonchifolius]
MITTMVRNETLRGSWVQLLVDHKTVAKGERWWSDVFQSAYGWRLKLWGAGKHTNDLFEIGRFNLVNFSWGWWQWCYEMLGDGFVDGLMDGMEGINV